MHLQLSTVHMAAGELDIAVVVAVVVAVALVFVKAFLFLVEVVCLELSVLVLGSKSMHNNLKFKRLKRISIIRKGIHTVIPGALKIGQ